MRISSTAERLSDTQEADGAAPSSSTTLSISSIVERESYILLTKGQNLDARPALLTQWLEYLFYTEDVVRSSRTESTIIAGGRRSLLGSLISFPLRARYPYPRPAPLAQWN